MPEPVQDVLARAEGPARADVGAEEAAMHLLDEEEGRYSDEEDYSAFTSDVENEGDEDGEDDEADRDDDSGEFVFASEIKLQPRGGGGRPAHPSRRVRQPAIDRPACGAIRCFGARRGAPDLQGLRCRG